MLSTFFTGGLLSFIHPAASLLVGFDLYLLLKSMVVMNQTVDYILLEKNKTEIILSKINFLGYEREKQLKVKLSEVRFLGKVENTSVLLENYGLLPSIGRMMRRKEDLEVAKEKNNFRYFLKFVARNESFLVAIDHEDHKSFCKSHELLEAIVQGK